MLPKFDSGTGDDHLCHHFSEVQKRKHAAGATMVEYTIMVAVFAIALIIAVGVMRSAVNDGFELVCTKLDGLSGVTVEGGCDSDA